jgi:hypothetical protein
MNNILYFKFLRLNRITEVEVSYQQAMQKTEAEQPVLETIRVIYMNELGAIPEVCTYKMVDDRLTPLDGRELACRSGESSFAKHPSIRQVQMQKKRYQANRIGTTYVYDFPIMFAKAIMDLWAEFKQSDPLSYKA